MIIKPSVLLLTYGRGPQRSRVAIIALGCQRAEPLAIQVHDPGTMAIAAAVEEAQQRMRRSHLKQATQ